MTEEGDTVQVKGSKALHQQHAFGTLVISLLQIPAESRFGTETIQEVGHDTEAGKREDNRG